MSPMGNGNGNGNGHGLPPGSLVLGSGERFHISQGQRWKCPKCGNEPMNPRPGVPEAVTTQLENDEMQYHCMVCMNEWQARKTVEEIRANVPRLVPILAE